ncbi:MAG: type II toxin-antitoxin system VapC family toxin [Bifidobacteriaceae bacterium]|nr:type II toxin-antitoxin system VapC family toxin [Bifidobacteriaceae bacterium]
MKVSADTNVLVRAHMLDDPDQARAAQDLLRRAELVVIPTVVLCEFAWVLRRAYRLEAPGIALAIRSLLGSATVRADTAAAEAGLAMLEAGGDFADAVIGLEGARMGAEEFATFDREAARRMPSAIRTRLLLRC